MVSALSLCLIIQVMAVVNSLEKQGLAVDLNVILDRLTRGVFN